MSFERLNLDSRLVKALSDNGIEKPTDIQKKAIPLVLEKQNVLALAPTGTGKTFAYLVPALHHLLNAKIEHNDPYIVILVPTRELAKQVYRFLKIFRKEVEITVQIASTGVAEIKDKSDFIDVVIATPGNLTKLVESHEISLDHTSIVIIDEVDRMVDMHFFDEVTHLLSYFPHKNQRQTLLFGSTLPQKVEPLVRQMQRNTVLVDLGRSTAPPTIDHVIYEVTREERYDVLREILQTEQIDSVIIFTRSQNSARITTKNLLRDGLDVEEIHGGLTQRQRSLALENFANGKVNALVATDIAARGIDIAELSHVISFDVPRKFDDYLHRAGRTGRIDSKGKSIILASDAELEHLEGIKKRLGPKKVTTARRIYREQKTTRKPREDNRPWTSSKKRKPTKKFKPFKKREKRK